MIKFYLKLSFIQLFCLLFSNRYQISICFTICFFYTCSIIMFFLTLSLTIWIKRWVYKHWVCNMLASILHTNIFLRKISWYWSFNWRCFFLYEICLNTERVPFGCYKSALPGTLLLTINTLEGVSTVSSNPVVLGPIGVIQGVAEQRVHYLSLESKPRSTTTPWFYRP